MKVHQTAYIERACYYFIANDVKTDETGTDAEISQGGSLAYVST